MQRFIVFALALTVLTSCTNNNTPSSEQTGITPSEQVSSGENAVSYKETLETSSKKITDTAEFNACITPHVNMCIQSVAREIAQRDNNIDFCQELALDADKASCMFGIVMSQVQTSEKIEDCDVLTDAHYKRECTNSVQRLFAQKNNNVQFCNNIEEREEGSSQEKNRCIMDIAERSSNASLCNQISDESEKQICQDMIKIRGELEGNTSPVQSAEQPEMVEPAA